ncbi:MAG: SDR family NAD(P)-dependent oxidoreductase [Lewinellaceae bacterium]|nr:SDR family NAD(P)-dependent oxidoreductase [Lewinellaceae bacterium]
MSTIYLVYAPENIDLAEQLTREIGRVGIPFQHITVRADEQPGQLAAQAESADGPVLLLLTDNFLKSSACMANALAMIQSLSRQNRLLTVVADGRKLLPDGRTSEPVPTQFDRVVHAIQYMNYWQTIYLDRTDRLPEVPPARREQFDRELEVVRRVANEVGEVFSALRETGYITWYDLKADDYARFFHQFGLQNQHAQYRSLAALDHEAPPPPEAEPLRDTPVTQAPAFAGLLAPQPEMPEAPPRVAQPSELPHPDEDAGGGSSLLEQLIETEPPSQPEPDRERTPEPQTIEMPSGNPEAVEQEIRQTIQDAWFWINKGYTERGLELFRLAIEQNPQHETLQAEYHRATQHHDDTPPTFQPSNLPTSQPSSQPAPEADSYNAMGDNALAKGDYLLAKYCWDRVTDLNPGYTGVYRKLAVLTCDHLTDYKETAAYYLEEAIAAEPGAADLHYRLAVLLRDHLNQPAKALQHFGDVVVLQPEHSEAWLALARFTFESGDHKQAESLYRHAVSLNPDLQSAEDDALFHAPQEQPEPVPLEPEAAPVAESEIPEEPLAQTEPEPTETPAPKPFAQPEPETPETPLRTAKPLTVLITGATSGIGRATAELFARHGHRLILTGRRADRLAELRQRFAADFHTDVLTLSFDVRDAAAVAEHLGNLPESWQNIDVLVNNAGLAKGLAPIHEGSLGHWETMIDTNIKGLLYVTRIIAPGMVHRRRGHIINIGSSAGKEVYPNGAVYCATKFAVDALTRGMRMDLYTHNVRVSQVSPGHVEETEFALTRFDGDAERAQIYQDFQPLKSADVAEAIYFAATRPPHVNVQDIWMFPNQQAASTMINRTGR